MGTESEGRSRESAVLYGSLPFTWIPENGLFVRNGSNAYPGTKTLLLEEDDKLCDPTDRE